MRDPRAGAANAALRSPPVDVHGRKSGRDQPVNGTWEIREGRVFAIELDLMGDGRKQN